MKKRVPISSSATPLPADFADQVLRQEINLEMNGSLESLKALLELYSVKLT
jgi:hypothetical protein